MIKVAGTTLEIVQGDITEISVDAIVNAANNHLWMGAGVAGAIKRKGDERIEQEAVSQGPVDVGEAVITSAGNLPASHVIHAVGMGQDLRTNGDKVASATRSSLALADENHLVNIAFPAIGTGVGGLSLEACAKTMIDTTVDFLVTSNSTLERVLFDQEGHDTFQKQLRSRFSK